MKQAHPFEWWVDKYEQKTGDKFVIPDGYRIAFDENNGFFLFKELYVDNYLVIDIAATCVTSWAWVIETLTPYAKAIGATHFSTATNRNEKAYAKLTGGTRKPEYDYDNYKVFVKEVV